MAKKITKKVAPKKATGLALAKTKKPSKTFYAWECREYDVTTGKYISPVIVHTAEEKEPLMNVSVTRKTEFDFKV